jgi:hypothetical protein
MRYAITAAIAMTIIGASSGALAKDDVAFSADKRFAFAVPSGAAKSATYYTPKSKAATIYSNLGTRYKNGMYYIGVGQSVFGNSQGSQYVATGFTPASSATAVEVQVAVGNFEDGNDKFTLSIASDNAGSPGTALASATFTAKNTFGYCCGLATARFPNGVSLKGGTPYWITVTVDAKQTQDNDDGAWMFSTTDEVIEAPAAYNSNNGGWSAYQTETPPAFGVFSK